MTINNVIRTLKNYFFIFITIFVLSVNVSQANPVKRGIHPDNQIKDLTVSRWTGEEGLISNNITSVSQSKDGYIWITSFNGIQRFDGVRFDLFDKDKLSFLNSNGFYGFYEDKIHNLWFASQASGIIRYSENQFQKVGKDSNLSLSVRCIFIDDEGNVWAGSNNKGVYIKEDSVFRKIKESKLDYINIMDIIQDEDGVIWIATAGNGIAKYQNGKIEFVTIKEGLNHNSVNKLFLMENGDILAGTQFGVNVITREGINSISETEGLEINDILTDDYGTIWLGAEQGLARYNIDLGIFEVYTQREGLPSSQISSICFDHENGLWVSTKKAGLLRFSQSFFKNITQQDGLSSNNVNIIVEHASGFYVGTDDGTVNTISNDKIRQNTFKNIKYNVGIRDIAFGDKGEMWVASYLGLLKIKGDTEKLITFVDEGIPKNDIRRIFKSKDGTLWLGTKSGGVIHMINDEEFKTFDSSGKLKSNYILSIEEDSLGNIYVGTHSGGLSVIKADGGVETYFINEDRSSGILIFNIYIEDTNNIWLSTNVGIYHFVSGTFSKIEFESDFQAETFFDLVDYKGTVWLSSNIGLLRTSMVELHASLKDPGYKPDPELFDHYDGMANHECTGATRMTLASDGRLWVPTLGGVAIIRTEDIIREKKKPNIYITGFMTDFDTVDINNPHPVISPGYMRYTFTYTALSYVAPPKVKFRYRLKDIDKDWIDAGNSRETYYTNLPYGIYTFEVQAKNNSGEWGDKIASISFKVKPYFYKTVWFYMLVILFIGILLMGAFAWRLRNIKKINHQLVKVNESLDRFVYSASHDLRAPLSSVQGLVDIARMEKSVDQKDDYLDMIKTSVKKLDSFIKDIIDYSRNQRIELKVEGIDIEQQAWNVFEELKYMDKDNRISVDVTSNEKRNFYTDGRRVDVILKNLVSNSYRYHMRVPEPFIKVNIHYQNNYAEISVIDNGKGIQADHIEHIFKMFYRAEDGNKGSGLGLYIVKETIDKLNGTIDVESKRGEGATFTVRIPSLK